MTGELQALRRAYLKAGSPKTALCSGCAHHTGKWPEGKAFVEKIEGMLLVHCPLLEGGWHVPPQQHDGCTRYMPDRSQTAAVSA